MIKDGVIKVDVLFADETVWLTQSQMSELFQRDITLISRHIGNVFHDGELAEESNLHFLQIANSDKPVKITVLMSLSRWDTESNPDKALNASWCNWVAKYIFSIRLCFFFCCHICLSYFCLGLRCAAEGGGFSVSEPVTHCDGSVVGYSMVSLPDCFLPPFALSYEPRGKSVSEKAAAVKESHGEDGQRGCQ